MNTALHPACSPLETHPYIAYPGCGPFRISFFLSTLFSLKNETPFFPLKDWVKTSMNTSPTPRGVSLHSSLVMEWGNWRQIGSEKLYKFRVRRGARKSPGQYGTRHFGSRTKRKRVRADGKCGVRSDLRCEPQC